MLKRILTVVAVVLVPVILFAGNTITKGSWAYEDIKDLVDSGIITKPLNKGSLTGAEAAEYINNGVENVLYAQNSSYSGSDEDLMAKIDKLYKLVKAYMEDLMKSDKKLDEILETIGDLKVKKAEIEEKQNRLLNLMGLRINGESSAYMTDLLLFGREYMGYDAAGNTLYAKRYRPITQFIDLKFSLNANKELYAEAIFRLENMFGGFWGSQDIYGLRRLFIQGDYPVSFVFGGYQGKLTPFTLWAVEEERPFEAEIFARKREMNRDELFLMNNTWPLTGGKVHTIVEIVEALDIEMMVMGARMGEAGKSNYQVYDPTSNAFIPQVYSHDQYLISGRLATDATLGDMLKIGINFSEIVDAKDTGKDAADYEKPVLDNYVVSYDGDVDMDVEENVNVNVHAELANSWYTNYKFENNYITGSALKAGVKVDAFNTNVGISYKDVGNSFTAYAAQTRIYDARNNELYLTQNSTWNISADPPSYEIGGRVFPFTKYNPAINVSYGDGEDAYTGLASDPEHYGNLLFYNRYESATNPYGDSTPNRSGIKLELSGNYGGGLIQPYVKYEMAGEKTAVIPGSDDLRSFSIMQAGVKAEYDFLALKAGYRSEDTSSDTVVAYASSIIDVGLEAEIMRKKLWARLGFKSIAFNGYEYNMYGGVYTMNTIKDNFAVTSMGGGLEYKIAKPATIGLSFTNTNIEDKRVVTAEEAAVTPYEEGYEFGNDNNYSAQELDIFVTINF